MMMFMLCQCVVRYCDRMVLVWSVNSVSAMDVGSISRLNFHSMCNTQAPKKKGHAERKADQSAAISQSMG
jgi:hypothetical protein